MLSKRANVFYLEHVRIKQKDGRIVWINDSLSDFAKEFEPYYNLPDKNTVFIMIGKGSSITDAAIRLLSESGVVIGFSGSGGTPLLSAVDPVLCYLNLNIALRNICKNGVKNGLLRAKELRWLSVFYPIE